MIGVVEPEPGAKQEKKITTKRGPQTGAKKGKEINTQRGRDRTNAHSRQTHSLPALFATLPQ